MPATPTDFSYLDAPEHLGKEYDHVRKALKLYVKVLEAAATQDQREPTVITTEEPDTRFKVAKVTKTHTYSYDKLLSDRFLRVLHYMNENFYNPNQGGPVDSDDPLYARALEEVKKMFYGVDQHSKPYQWPYHGKMCVKDQVKVETGQEYTQRMWSLPPELLEPTIAICIARDFLGCRKLKFRPEDTITVRGQEVRPWKGFAARYCSLILSN